MEFIPIYGNLNVQEETQRDQLPNIEIDGVAPHRITPPDCKISFFIFNIFYLEFRFFVTPDT